jgi:peroxiredoxin
MLALTASSNIGRNSQFGGSWRKERSCPGNSARGFGALGDRTNSINLAKGLLESSTNQAPALALAAYVSWESGDTNAASTAFRQLRAISASFDLSTPIFARLAPIAESLGLPKDWRLPATERPDIGKRPPLDSLGPFRWQPYTAPAWTLSDAQHRPNSLADYRGRPVLVVFYLGYGCAHCLEQLNLLAPAAGQFKAQGISIVAVSTATEEGLHATAQRATQEGGFPFPILSDHSLQTFKDYHAYDDFEQMPLHGTFLVDGAGKVRWQDISYEPFADVQFLVAESRRLLGLSNGQLAKKTH